MEKIHIDKLLGRYKSEEFTNLIKSWIDNFDSKKILKTDLREEAFGDDEILFSLSNKNSAFFALDIEDDTSKKAYIRQRAYGFSHKYLTADVRELPFKNDVFDTIVSSSTLDHFNSEDDLIKSLLELKRVTKIGGNLIIALNNKHNVIFRLMLELERTFGLISYPVQFYSLNNLRKIIDSIGLTIRNESYIVHIISPCNGILLLLRRWINKDIVNRLAGMSIYLFRWLGNRKRSKSLSGWFIALNCAKEAS